MEITKIEVVNIEDGVAAKNETEMCELLDLQLALVGGGIGEVIVG